MRGPKVRKMRRPKADSTRSRAAKALSQRRVVVSLDDSTMDKILDDLTAAAGLPRNTGALGLARWDLKAALRAHAVEDSRG